MKIKSCYGNREVLSCKTEVTRAFQVEKIANSRRLGGVKGIPGKCVGLE